MNATSPEDRVTSCVALLTSKPDFPAFSHHVQQVLAAVDDEEATMRELTGLIVRDYSLTLKLLRCANSYNYTGRQILSATHAVIMLGMEGVRNLASSLLIFEHFHNKPAGVRELMMLSMLSANHVRGIGRLVEEIKPEEAYLCGMVRNLGEVLIAYYFPAQYAEILSRMQKEKQPAAGICREVLHFTFEDLGEAVARYWGMPAPVVSCVRPPPPAVVRSSPEERLRAAVALGNVMTTAVYRMDPQAGAKELESGLRQYRTVLPLDKRDVEEILQSAITETRESFAAMHVPIDQLRLEALTHSTLEAMAQASAPAAGGDTAHDPESLQAVFDIQTATDSAPAAGAALSAPNSENASLDRLTQEVCAVLESSAELELNTLILMVLEAIYRGGCFDRVIFAFVNQDRTRIEGRVGLGDGVDHLMEKFNFRLSLAGGPIAVALLCKRVVVINAAKNRDNKIVNFFNCGSLGLLPIIIAHQIVGCIYFESRIPRPDPSESQLRLLDQLRNTLAETIMRLRNSSAAPRIRRVSQLAR